MGVFPPTPGRFPRQVSRLSRSDGKTQPLLQKVTWLALVWKEVRWTCDDLTNQIRRVYVRIHADMETNQGSGGERAPCPQGKGR